MGAKDNSCSVVIESYRLSVQIYSDIKFKLYRVVIKFLTEITGTSKTGVYIDCQICIFFQVG